MENFNLFALFISNSFLPIYPETLRNGVKVILSMEKEKENFLDIWGQALQAINASIFQIAWLGTFWTALFPIINLLVHGFYCKW